MKFTFEDLAGEVALVAVGAAFTMKWGHIRHIVYLQDHVPS